jgi:hypothetical protein
LAGAKQTAVRNDRAMSIRSQSRRQARNDGRHREHLLRPADMSFALHLLRPGDLFSTLTPVSVAIPCWPAQCAVLDRLHSSPIRTRRMHSNAMSQSTVSTISSPCTANRSAQTATSGSSQDSAPSSTWLASMRPDTRVVPSVSLDSLECRPTLIKFDVESG